MVCRLDRPQEVHVVSPVRDCDPHRAWLDIRPLPRAGCREVATRSWSLYIARPWRGQSAMFCAESPVASEACRNPAPRPNTFKVYKDSLHSKDFNLFYMESQIS